MCCSTEAQSVSTPPSTAPAQAIPFQDLPQTECPSHLECVKDQFCDKSGSIRPVRVQLTKQEKILRGELIVKRLEVNLVTIFLCFSPVSMLKPASSKSAVKGNTASKNLKNSQAKQFLCSGRFLFMKLFIEVLNYRHTCTLGLVC